VIAQRKTTNKEAAGGGRRQKATHIILTGNGISSPQTLSIRGKVFEHLKANHAIGDTVSIDELAESAKHLLYGSSIRSYLSKLEEMGHLDFVVIAVEPEHNVDAGKDTQEESAE
jgi:hypothetical protein